MRELRIDVDNLCSFMPQDKVGNFSLQSPEGILQKTLEAISSIDEPEKNLHEVQKELAVIQVDKNIHQSQLDAKEKTLANLVQTIAGMETDVARINSRQENQRLLEMVKLKLICSEAQKQRDAVRDMNNLVDTAEASLVAKEREIAPLEGAERDLKKRVAQREKANDGVQTKLQTTDRDIKVEKKNVDDVEIVMTEVTEQLRNSAKSRKNLEKTRDDLINELSSLEQKLQQVLEGIPQLDQKLAEVTATLTKQTEDQSLLSESVQECVDHLQRIDTELLGLDRDLRNVRDPAVIFRNRLQAVDSNYYDNDIKFMDKFRLEKGKAGFEKEVYGPVGLHLNINDPVVAAMLEKAIPRARMLTYIVQTENDERKLRAMNARVNITTIKNASLDERPHSKQSLADMHIPGLEGYLTDLVTCPLVVKTFLNDVLSLFGHLVARPGNNAIRSEHYQNLCPGNSGVSRFNLFVHSAKATNRNPLGSLELIDGTRSRYNRSHLSLKTEVNINMHTRVLKVVEAVGDVPDVAALEHRRQVLLAERTKFQNQLKSLQTQQAKLRADYEKHAASKKAILDSKRQPAVYNHKIKTVKERLDDANKRLSKDPKIENAELLKRRQHAIDSSLKSMSTIVARISERSALEISLAIEEEMRQDLMGALSSAADHLAFARQSLNEFKGAKRLAERRRDDAIERMKEVTAQLDEWKQKHASNDEFVRYYQQEVLPNVPETDIEQLELRIAYLTTQLENVVEDPTLLERYKALVKERDSTARQVEQMRHEVEHREESIQRRSKHWLEQVEAIAQKLDAQFAAYMGHLSYSGEVELKKRGNFDKFEMQMRVNFRANEMMQDLSGMRHSGGERAVSTIMYLMALQEMTHTPFRAVDEINQGMDERNERLVFDRIVQSCCDKSKPQYFLVSPKLLQGLRAMEHDDVTVLVIWNGPGVAYKWKLADAIDRAHGSGSAVKDLTGSGSRGRERPVIDDGDDDDDDEPAQRKMAKRTR